MAAAYYFALAGGMKLVWGVLLGLDPQHLPAGPAFRPAILAVTTAGGLLVGLALHFLGVPGEIAAVVDNIHLDRGRIDGRQTPSMIVVSLLSIAAGGSAGPEAPLVQIVGSFGSWVGDRLRLGGDQVRTLTFCGMGTALGAFFGAPLAGALFALEIPHRRGLEYYEALVPAVVSAIVGFFLFRGIVGYEGALYHLPAVAKLSLVHVAAGAGLGVIGAAAASVFALIFGGVERLTHRVARHRILLATAGGVLIGLIAQVAPLTLFWGEFQVQSLIDGAGGTGGVAAGGLLLLALAKMLAVSFTLHCGFRGGFIFPLFFIGAAVGLAGSAVVPGVPPVIAVLCAMAAVNVAVTKTPVSTSVLLTALSGSHALPAIAVASFTSFLLTTRVSIIRTQRPRRALPIPGARCPS